MPLTEIFLTTIVEKVFSYALDQGQGVIEDWVRKKLNLDPKQQAFKRALKRAYNKFEKKYPQWAADLFNASFFEHEGAPILAQFLVRDGHPDPSELATYWADSLNIRNSERHTTLVRDLEPAATDFLDYLAQELKKEPELSDLNDSRAFEQLARDLKAIRYKLEAEQATPGTLKDYLLWLIERNLYLDPRGTYQTQRQVQVKLDEVYISLRAQRDKSPGEVDRRLLEQEMAQLEAKRARGNLSAEVIEVEDQREHLLARLDNHKIDTTNAPGEILELAEVVNRHERLVILGDPGSGKSTLLRYLALKHAQALYAGRSKAVSDLGEARFPILIRIADYAEHGMPNGKSLSNYLADYYNMHECPKFGLADLLANELAEGNCLVLLDGLDEIVSADDRRKVVERIEDFIRYHDNCPNRFVITSRIAGYRSAPLGDPFVQYTVQEMDDTQIRRFLERWCTAVEAAQTPELSQEARDVVARREIDGIMQAVQSTPGVHRLAANPLLLRTLALIHRTGAQLPQKRIELYKLAADTLGRTWRTAQGVPESALVDDRYLTRLLGRLAYWLHENKSTGTASEQEVYRELGQEWALIKGLDWEEDNPDIENEVKKFLQAVREHTGLFVERAPKLYGFMHLTFEEYYAARYLVARSKNRAKLIREYLHQPRWEEPILLAIGFVGLDSPEDAAELLETAIMAEGEEAKELGFTPSPYEELLGRDYLFALRCLGDNIPTRPKFMQQLVKRLADELLYQTGPAKFNRYQQILEERVENLKGNDCAIRLSLHLISSLSSTDPNIRRLAAESLGNLGQTSPKVITALINTLHNDPNADVRYAAASDLVQLPEITSEVVTALINALRIDPDSHVQEKLGSLGYSGQVPTKVVAILTNTLQNDPSFRVRLVVALSLGRLRQVPPEVITILINTLYNDPDTDVRRAAAESLGGSGLASPEVITALIDALRNDPDRNVRPAAAWNLVRLQQTPPEVITALIDALNNDSSSQVRYAAVWSLGKLQQTPPEVITALIDALHNDPDPGVRRGAAKSLVGLGQASPKGVAALINAQRNEADSDTRLAVVEYLKDLKEDSPEVITALINSLHNDADSDVRHAAVRTLRDLGQASSIVIKAFINALYKDTDSKVCLSAIRSLGGLGQASPEVVTALTNALHNDPDPDVRYAAAWNLVILLPASAEVTKALIKSLDNDPVPFVRRVAARSLERLGQASLEVVTALTNALHNDPDSEVRSEAAMSLGKLDQALSEVIPMLLNTIYTAKSWSIRSASAFLLGQIGQSDEPTVQALWHGLLDTDNDVRTACAQALAQLGQRFPNSAETIERKLVQAIVNPEFDKLDSMSRRSGHDYAYDGLWLLVVGGEIEAP